MAQTQTRSELINSVLAFHGKIITREIIETWSDERILAYTHPWHSQRKGKGW